MIPQMTSELSPVSPVILHLMKQPTHEKQQHKYKHIHSLDSPSRIVTVERRACQGLKQECAVNALSPDQLCYDMDQRREQGGSIRSSLKPSGEEKLKHQKENVFTDLIFLGFA